MLYNERKSMLFRRIKDGLSDDLLVNEVEVNLLEVDTPSIPFNKNLNIYLDDLLMIAKGIIFDERFPYHEQERPEDVEEIYHTLQVMIAIEIFNKEGYEGLVNFSENGLSQSYSSADVSSSLISRIMPKVSIV